MTIVFPIKENPKNQNLFKPKVFSSYMAQSYKIATIGSHSALQILKGAKDEGFETICVCLKGREEPYRNFKVADKIYVIDDYKELFTLQDELIKENAIIVPHASFIA